MATWRRRKTENGKFRERRERGMGRGRERVKREGES